jgi:hypothetical protein
MQYRLCHLLGVIAGICLWLAVIANASWRQANAVVAIRSTGGHVWYDDEAHGAESAAGNWKDRFTPMGVRNLLPRDVYSSVASVSIADAPVPTDVLKKLDGLSHLRHLSLVNVGLTDESLKSVGTLLDLRVLDLSWNEGITDLGIAHLRALKALDVLSLDGTAVRGRTLNVLDAAPTLRELSICMTPVDDSRACKKYCVNQGNVILPELPKPRRLTHGCERTEQS